ncbi:MAG: M48 family metallopeptidase [Ignavibacterium sp.]|nr:M48 family metallopeptidase [Ignavibacterium sp.]
MDVKKYNRIKLWTSISNSVLFFIVTLIFITQGFGKYIESLILPNIKSEYLAFIVFVFVYSIITSLFTFPLSFYSSYILEHKYKLSNQSLSKYFIDKIKSQIISIIIAIPVLILFYYLMKNYPETWWLFFSAAMFFISVVLAQLFPILIFPLFFKLKPIDDESLINVIKDLAEQTNFKFSNIYSFDLSSKTKKANAALTGLGKTKKIILGDTLLNLLSVDEIKTVLAHEIGHYKLNHIPKNILFSTVISFITFYLIAELYKNSLSFFGFESITQISAFPLLIIWGAIVGLFITPISNIISRKFEYEADNYAIQVTNMPESFKSALTKLFDKNLADKEPHPFVEWYFYSHPSYNKRLRNIDNTLTILNPQEQLN